MCGRVRFDASTLHKFAARIAARIAVQSITPIACMCAMIAHMQAIGVICRACTKRDNDSNRLDKHITQKRVIL